MVGGHNNSSNSEYSGYVGGVSDNTYYTLSAETRAAISAGTAATTARSELRKASSSMYCCPTNQSWWPPYLPDDDQRVSLAEQSS
ncbi:hypothetical protein PF002_g25192 [Phytophthora fragariae]|uniref:Uncharacterized protein n=1 Tax=Phytophthora fragariae TaxID=53985 RepID=A0A6A3DSZ1_9STRA|nr:hypothetical protein PF009_g25072 [Phytophthora fragariae]KAE8979027.1 hypothetical protein PF011_g23008 [Phytophthora fragariae]KAE9097514.1 hypothetical protein PF006_g23561 [Phytophthora fragariae]KAE9186275.1 hypothetical protein PF004_g23130 [Phytophthora fragariae]KAE9188888.1 hypothetical protein PF002_g25192 [Phytophthora fragariae]